MSDSPDPFVPEQGGRKGRVVLRFSLSENSRVTVVIKKHGRVVRFLLRAQPRRRGSTAVVWSGRNRDGRVVRAGKYHYVITATDAHGNRSPAIRGRISVIR